jgi:hypothetical protein
MITLASLAARYAVLSWLAPVAPLVLLAGFLLTTVSITAQGLHVALQSDGSTALRTTWEKLGKKNFLLAVIATVGVLALLLPRLVPLLPAPLAHFFSNFLVSTLFTAGGALAVALVVGLCAFHFASEERKGNIGWVGLGERLGNQHQNTGGWVKGLAVLFGVVAPAILLSLRFVPSFSGAALTHLFSTPVGIISAGTLWTAGAILLSALSLASYVGYMLLQRSDVVEAQSFTPPLYGPISTPSGQSWLNCCVRPRTDSASSAELPSVSLSKGDKANKPGFLERLAGRCLYGP